MQTIQGLFYLAFQHFPLLYPVFPSPSVFTEPDPALAEREHVLQYAAAVTLYIASGKNNTNKHRASDGIRLP